MNMKPLEDELKDVSEPQLERKLKDFSDMVDAIKDLPEKQRALWTEIYENALADRHNAFIMFRGMVKLVQGSTAGAFSSSEMAVHGKTIATFIEKMSKANDQLLRLAEMIGKSTSKDDVPIDWEKELARK